MADDDTTTYRVVINHEEQYSIWPEGRELPLGWTEAGHSGHVVVQTLTTAYVARHGLPMTRRERPAVAWYGDMELMPHLGAYLMGGPLDVVCSWGKPMALDTGSDRKAVTRAAEQEVRATYARLITGRG